jgi:hypothetical protein
VICERKTHPFFPKKNPIHSFNPSVILNGGLALVIKLN